jgi:hypothetical protein
LCHLPSEKSSQDEQQLGAQVVERGLDLLLGPDSIPLDLLLGPGDIAHLPHLKAQAAIIAADEGDVGVALCRLPEGTVQEDASRVDAERRY